MREILFKGKRVDNGEWVYGYLIKGAARYVIQESIAQYPQYDVIPETVSQYTGLEDKNGKKIFEGDIMKNKLGGVGIVKYSKYAEFILDFIDDCTCTSFNPVTLRNYEVIGNVFDEKE